MTFIEGSQNKQHRRHKCKIRGNPLHMQVFLCENYKITEVTPSHHELALHLCVIGMRLLQLYSVLGFSRQKFLRSHASLMVLFLEAYGHLISKIPH